MEYWIDILKLIGCSLFILLGFLGCFIPIPGPLLAWVGVLLLDLILDASISSVFIICSLVIVVLITILDYVIPLWGAKKFGGTKYGIWGSTLGLIVGFLFTPIGMLMGLILGAFIGEYLYNKNVNQSLRSTVGTLIGFATGIVLKLGYCIAMTYYFFKYSYPLIAN